MLTNPKVTIVTDDGRRWLRPQSRAPFRRHRLEHDLAFPRQRHQSALGGVPRSGQGIISTRAASSSTTPPIPLASSAPAASPSPYGARFTNHMVVSPTPIAWDFARWRRTLEAYRIDGRRMFDPARERRPRAARPPDVHGSKPHRQGGPHDERPIEPCPDILARTAGKQIDHRRQYGQRVALFPRTGMTLRSASAPAAARPNSRPPANQACRCDVAGNSQSDQGQGNRNALAPPAGNRQPLEGFRRRR